MAQIPSTNIQLPLSDKTLEFLRDVGAPTIVNILLIAIIAQKLDAQAVLLYQILQAVTR